jgi:hypothetical protein
VTKSKKAVVYTALVGEYDYLRPVPKGLTDIDFICFTDGSLSENYCERKGWLLRRLPKGTDSSRKGCRQLKSMPQSFLSEYDVSVWLDSNISFKRSIGKLIDEFISSKALVRGFRHPSRSCAYLEAEECIRQGKDAEKNLRSMVDHMRFSGFPERHGLTETNVLFRKHHVKNVEALNEDWSYFLSEFTIRDQISFDYLCWRHGIDVWYFGGSTHRNEHPVFSRGLHRSKDKLKDKFAYFESLQGVYPSLGRVIKLIYTKFG